MIDGVFLTPLKIIEVLGGDVLHAMKRQDSGFIDFGEAYFSTIEPGAVKAWKRHREMTQNLVVPVGAIKFVLFDEREGACAHGVFEEIVLSRENYCRLTIPPMVWVGFQGMHKEISMLLNIASIPHTPEESDRKEKMELDYDWSSNV